MRFNVVKEMTRKYDKNVMIYFEEDVLACHCISEPNKELVEKLLELNKFKGEEGQIEEIKILENSSIMNLCYLGAGKKEKFTPETLRTIIFKALNGFKGDVLITANNGEVLDVDALHEIGIYLNYDFNKYKSDKKAKEINIDIFRMDSETIGNGDEGKILGESVCIVRDLINEPANVIYPESLANIAVELGKKYNLSVEVKEEKEIESLKMDAFLSVARAAEKRPKLIIIKYLGDPENKNEITGLIGKGLTYDTGGLSLKPTDSMLTMKDDMSGAATVIGAMIAISRMKLKKNIVGIIAACENSIGGNAYRPGDIIGSMNGKTIEVNNTDAEGRLTLVDAITYAIRKENVTEVVDLATLTGAILVALGYNTTGVFTNTDEMYKKIEKSSTKYGETVWRMPLFDEYKDMLKSDVADLVNSGGRYGGSSSAAKFLEEFVEGKPWMHLDIAGTAFNSKGVNYYSKGATGRVVRALYDYFKN